MIRKPARPQGAAPVFYLLHPLPTPFLLATLSLWLRYFCCHISQPATEEMFSMYDLLGRMQELNTPDPRRFAKSDKRGASDNTTAAPAMPTLSLSAATAFSGPAGGPSGTDLRVFTAIDGDGSSTG